jgi:four helix bundle protein
LRSGTSIGANVEEAIGGQSNRDFLSKMSIAYKEARETHYWLRLLRDSGMLDAKHADSVIEECDELLKLSGSIIKTTKNKIS